MGISTGRAMGLVRRGGTYIYRQRVPKDLLEVIGQREWKVSLKTSDRAQAVVEAKRIAAEIATRIAQARRTLPPALPAGLPPRAFLTPEEVEFLAQSARHRLMVRDDEFRAAGPSRIALGEHVSDLADRYHELSARLPVGALGGSFRREFERDLQALGVEIGRDSQGYRTAAFRWMQGQMSALEALSVRSRGEGWPETPASPSLPATLAEQANAAADSDAQRSKVRRDSVARRGGRLLRNLVEDWLAEPGLKQQTKDRRRRVWQDVIAFSGDPSLTPEGLTDDLAVRYYDSLIASKKAAATVSSTLGALTAFHAWARSRRIVPRDAQSPFADFRVSRSALGSGSRPKRRPYTEAELKALLAGPLKSDKRAITDKYLRDLIPLMLTTGLRINEACSLLVEDVYFTEDTHGPFAVLSVAEGKTDAASREVAAVAPEVLAMLARRCEGKKPGDQVFDELSPGGPDSKLSWSAVKAFTRYRRQCGIPDGPDAHSLRRLFATALEQAEVPAVVAQRVLGHDVPSLMHKVYSAGASRAQIVDACRRAYAKLPHVDGGTMGKVGNEIRWMISRRAASL